MIIGFDNLISATLTLNGYAIEPVIVTANSKPMKSIAGLYLPVWRPVYVCVYWKQAIYWGALCVCLRAWRYNDVVAGGRARNCALCASVIATHTPNFPIRLRNGTHRSLTPRSTPVIPYHHPIFSLFPKTHAVIRNRLMVHLSQLSLWLFIDVFHYL